MSDTKTAGVKHDSEKIRHELLSVTFLEELSLVLTFGAKKYNSHNWRGGFAWSRLIGAALRHTLAFMRGEDRDPESGLLHTAHAACCLMFLTEHYKRKLGQDDRYKETMPDERN